METPKPWLTYTDAEMQQMIEARAYWVSSLTPGTVIECHYNGSRKTIVLAWRRSDSCSSGYQIKAKHNRQWMDSFNFKPCKNQDYPIAFTRPRIDTPY